MTSKTDLGLLKATIAQHLDLGIKNAHGLTLTFEMRSRETEDSG